MKRKFLSGIICILCLSIFFNTSVSASSDKALNWYCVRNKEHKQPTIDKELQIIEKYNAYYVDRSRAEEKVIYLTFDAGYENGNIEKILDVLKAEETSAAFFILENLVVKNPQLVKRMAEEGHLVCNHTANHKDITKIDNDGLKKELNDLESIYKEVTGRDLAKYFRPPEGRFDSQSLEYISSLGYKTIFWSFAYADWDNKSQPSAESAKKKIFDNIHNGEIILLHPTSATNAQILGDVIKALKEQGYRFGTLDDLTA